MERIDRLEEMVKELMTAQAKTDAQMKETMKTLSGIGVNLGATAEEYFFHALEKTKRIGQIQFDEIDPNVRHRRGNLQGEFDIVLYNGDSLGLVEIKHRVHPNDLKNLVEKKAETYRALFPEYKDYKIYLAIGGFSIPPEVAQEAHEKGVAVLRQNGDVIEMDDASLRAY